MMKLIVTIYNWKRIPEFNIYLKYFAPAYERERF